MKKMYFRFIAVLLIAALCASLVTACGSSETTPEPSPAPVDNTDNAVAPIEPLVEEDPVVEGLSIEQRSSMAMMNFLAYAVQNINDSRRSRITLEEVFDDLLNNVEKSSIDGRSLQEFNKIFDTIKTYRMNAIAFERLEFISGQTNAAALLALVPNPIEVVASVAQNGTLITLAGLAFSTFDKVTESSALSSAEEAAYLEKKWTLEDTEERALMDSRTNMFSYMVEIAQGLPTGITLTENDIEEFVQYAVNGSGASKLDWLEKNQDRYQYFAYYWLELADSYYENGDFANCLSAVETYRANDTGIFKLDKRLSQSLIYAIASAKEVLSGAEYEAAVADYANSIIKNIGPDDWLPRLYASTAYLDLYEATNNTKYLDAAYEEAKNNVRYLVPKQQKENDFFLADVVEAKADDGASKEETSLIKAYNKFIKNKRETELPPVCEPLLRSCEWLFAVAEKKGISDSEKNVIDSILHDEPVFLSYELDKKFSYNKTSSIPGLSGESMSYSGVLADQKFTIPAVLAPAGTSVSGEAVVGGETIALENWSVNEVDRNKSKNVYDFEAVFTCKAPKTIVFKTGDTITLSLTPPGANAADEVITVKMVVDKLTVGVPHFTVESIAPEMPTQP